MTATIQIRRDTAAAWITANPILAEGELGYITDGTKGLKIGDGITHWNDLQFIPLKMEFSSNLEYWHFPAVDGDSYIRFAVNGGGWTDPIQWRGTDGVTPDGWTWHDYSGGEWESYFPYAKYEIVWRRKSNEAVRRVWIALEAIGDGELPPEEDSRWAMIMECWDYVNRGEWSSGNTYKINNIVTRLGSVYRSKLDDTEGNHAPELEPDYWELWASKGDTGEQGIQGDPASSGQLDYRLVTAELNYEQEIFSTDTFINYDSQSYGGMNLNIPQASTVPAGKIYYFKDSKGYGGSADVYVHPYYGDTIDNSGDVTLNNGNDWLILVCDGISNWMIMSIGHR